ncbi:MULTISPECIES: TrkH family potassium uptake protein [Niallia]|jgi:trk system potassium uptake protein|uniref:Ktr system potassium transporter B n=1 Tax=Niallia circulans TaxID=1397 RepID=A0AA91TQU5_NIACI|nr:TrkH family potassium uptake protein [Niallia circulans]AYV72650.1 Ktr system potassium transporter B [Niallia circulans]NRG27105.1 Ktr system potassium transporter B [Niallia circulans]PAD82425.1 Ktr system potassium transporter B [Niallia circulans]QJX60443.1 Ktr system potassium transporter B [Niallia circulans]
MRFPKKKDIIALNPPQILIFVFLAFTLLGTMLLKMPLATTGTITWTDALFTSTSAMTVTGLAVIDTGGSFTLFGEIVILCLIQVGGLGIMTFAVLIFMTLGRKIGFKERLLIQQALGQTSIGGIIKLAKQLFLFSITLETIAAVLLAIRWVPEMGWQKGVYAAIFHSISSFNNAGFSIWPDNLSRYVADPVVNIVISLLFIIGGIGFTVIFDLWKKSEFKKLTLHTKIMVVGTIVINVVAVLLVFGFEYDNPQTLGDLSWSGKIQAAYFQGVVPRTAGFNTVDIGGLNESTLFFMILLMFIGAGSGSTGGGIKLTTFLAMVFSVLSFLRNKEDIVIFNRSIDDRTVVKSLAITIISLFVIFVAIFILDITEKDARFLAIVFEVVSAFGTSGLSMGLTSTLTMAGKFVIVLVMFVGKIGPLTLAFSLAKPNKSKIRFPKEDILTG